MAKTTCDALEILDRLTGDDPELREMIAEEAVHAQAERLATDLEPESEVPLHALEEDSA